MYVYICVCGYGGKVIAITYKLPSSACVRACVFDNLESGGSAAERDIPGAKCARGEKESFRYDG